MENPRYKGSPFFLGDLTIMLYKIAGTGYMFKLLKMKKRQEKLAGITKK
jgi:hypothetical protein